LQNALLTALLIRDKVFVLDVAVLQVASRRTAKTAEALSAMFAATHRAECCMLRGLKLIDISYKDPVRTAL
jgi:hypothetical protein